MRQPASRRGNQATGQALARRWRLPLLLVAMAWLLAGCAAMQTQALRAEAPSGLPPRVELADTPFHAQEDYQCGPAALAMLLQAAGKPVPPQQLVNEVYLPARQGSLQPEMLASARRNGMLGVTIAPDMRALLAEVAAGHPVVVLQNLSLPLFPRWHYAVVIGYDLPAGDGILRSGTTRRLVMSMSTFEHTWQRSQAWGMVALPPGMLPATSSPADISTALLALDKNLPPAATRPGWESAARRWPEDAGLQLGWGNSAYAAGDKASALEIFQAAAGRHPEDVALLNNLASLLAESGRLQEAEPVARKAASLGGPLAPAAQATLRDIQARLGQR